MMTYLGNVLLLAAMGIPIAIARAGCDGLGVAAARTKWDPVGTPMLCLSGSGTGIPVAFFWVD